MDRLGEETESKKRRFQGPDVKPIRRFVRTERALPTFCRVWCPGPAGWARCSVFPLSPAAQKKGPFGWHALYSVPTVLCPFCRTLKVSQLLVQTHGSEFRACGSTMSAAFKVWGESDNLRHGPIATGHRLSRRRAGRQLIHRMHDSSTGTYGGSTLAKPYSIWQPTAARSEQRAALVT